MILQENRHYALCNAIKNLAHAIKDKDNDQISQFYFQIVGILDKPARLQHRNELLG